MNTEEEASEPEFEHPDERIHGMGKMKALRLRGTQNEIIQSTDWIQDRDNLISDAALIVGVRSQALLTMATDSVKELKAMVRALDDTRKEVKAPVLVLGDAVDATSKALARPLLLELARLEGEIGTYSREQQRIRDEQARALQREREAEEKRIWEARQAEDRRIREEQAAANREAEAKRQAELAKAKNEADAQRIKYEAECRKAENERHAAAALAASQQAATVSTQQMGELFVATVQPKLPVKMVWKFEVTDVSALVAYDSGLIIWDPAIAQINRLIALGARTIPGLRIWEEQEVRIR